MAFAHAAHLGEIEPDVQDFYEDFTTNPSDAVLTRGVGRVIEVVPGNPAREPGSDDPFRDVPVDDVADVELPPSAGDDIAPQAWRLVGTGVVETVSQDGVTVLRIPDTVHFRVPAVPTGSPWVLVPHVDPPVARRAAAFRFELARQLGLSQTKLDDWFVDPNRMRDLVTTHLKKLTDSYRSAQPA